MSWSKFDKFDNSPKYNHDKYFVSRGEGENKATQIVTAINKLVYKWFNDGDVYDNRYCLNGWCNDLSSYANWLYYNTTEKIQQILDEIENVICDSEYEKLLYDLCGEITADYLDSEALIEKTGTIYKSAIKHFEFVEYDEYDEEEN